MPKVLSLAWETILEIEHAFEDKHCQPEDILKLFRILHNDVQNIHDELAVYINTLSWDRPIICYNNDDDEDCTIAITPNLSTEEPDNSLSMGDEHLNTIPEIESDELIKSSVENLVPIPNESEGIPDNMCDVPFRDNSPSLDISKDQFEDFFDSNDDSTSIDDDSFSIDDIKYVEASPPDSELVSLEVVEIVIPKVGGIDADILLTIKGSILCEKLLNVNLLIAEIKALKDNPTPSSDIVAKSSSTSLNFLLEETNTFDNSLLESETFCFNLEEISSGSITTRSDYSLPDYEPFYDDHIKEKSSSSTTTYSDFSLSKYDSADRNSQMYYTFSKMLKNFDREDLEVLWRLVKDRFIKSKPVGDMDSFLLHTLKTMFEHHDEDTVWRNQQGLAKIGQETAKGRIHSSMKCLDESLKIQKMNIKFRGGLLGLKVFMKLLLLILKTK
nr:hypothetical protein [Tanacetum cinerariifolium]